MNNVCYEQLLLNFQEQVFEAFLTTADDSKRYKLTNQIENLFSNIICYLEPQIIAEIGAHEATFSQKCIKDLPNSRVVAFEANPVVHAMHKDKMLSLGVDYINSAVANHDGLINIKIPIREDGFEISTMASILPTTWAADFNNFEVASVRLDSFLTRDRSKSSAFWIDVEGAIGEVLKSADQSLQSCILLYAEIEPSDKAWPGQMLDYDVISLLNKYNLVPIVRDVQRKGWQYNCIFIKKNLLNDKFIIDLVSQCFNSILKI